MRRAVEPTTAGDLALLVESSPGEIRQIVILPDGIALGRNQFGPPFAEDDGISRIHAFVSRDGAGVKVRDLNSHNGTFLNGELIHAPTHMSLGDRLNVGSVELILARKSEKIELVLDYESYQKKIDEEHDSRSISSDDYEAQTGTGQLPPLPSVGRRPAYLRPLQAEDRVLLIATAAVGVAVVAIAGIALSSLASRSRNDAWVPVLQDILKTGYQALAIGALGGLAKLFIDRRKSREVADSDLRDLRRSYIATVVSASHDIDNTRMLIQANRSVETWTDLLNKVLVPARTHLRGVAHDLLNWDRAGEQVFAESGRIQRNLEMMYDYLGLLIEEHAAHKQRLAEMQRLAEEAKGWRRRRKLNAVWSELLSLPISRDLLEDGEKYHFFHDAYLDVLSTMRMSLALSRSRSKAN